MHSYIFTNSTRHPNCNIGRADWEGFSQSATFEDKECPSVNCLAENFTNAILQRSHIPVSSTRPRRLPVPWWTDECRFAIRARKRALWHFHALPAQENLIAVKRLCARAQRPHERLNAHLGGRLSTPFPDRRVLMLFARNYGACEENAIRSPFLEFLLVAPFLQRRTTLPTPSLQISHQSVAQAITILVLEPQRTARKLPSKLLA
jgi:hypothetical protein